MLYVITCKDKSDHIPVCMENRPAHVAFSKTHLDNLAEAETWAAQDPYAKASLFKSEAITDWKKVFPEAE